MPQSILERIAAQDESAVRECLDRYGPLVWSLARRMSPNAADAEDAVQEIFVALWRSAARFDPQTASETTFVAMIARRRLIDRLRTQSRSPEMRSIDETSSIGADGSGRQIEAALDVERAARAMESLRPEQRKVLELAVGRGLTHQQVAEATGMPLGTVKTHARRGLIRVRELLAETGEDAS